MKALLLGVTATLALAACTGPHPTDARRPTTTASSSSPEPTDPSASPATPGSVSLQCGNSRHLVGERHNISGDVFVAPLRSPPARDHNNKILWRTRHSGGGDLFVSASLNGSAVSVHRRIQQTMTVGSAMPSIINVPKAGCWTFSLRWGRQRDVVAVRYSTPS